MLWFWIVLQVVAAVLYGNLLEWILHKYVLHGLGKRKKFFSEHWHRHHRHARKMGFFDPDYKGISAQWDARWSEVVSLGVLALLHLPVVFVAPMLYAGLVLWTVLYYTIHATGHSYPKLGKKLFPWHYDHHMGKNQDANWCVTYPLWDYILGTRVKYGDSNH